MENSEDMAPRASNKLKTEKFESRWDWIKRQFFGLNTNANKQGEIATIDIAGEKKNTNDMLVNLRNLQTLRLDDVSIPKADIIALSEDSSHEDVIEIFRTSAFTRVPVYCDTLDNPLGLIHLKDFALSHGFGSDKPFKIKSLLDLNIFFISKTQL